MDINRQVKFIFSYICITIWFAAAVSAVFAASPPPAAGNAETAELAASTPSAAGKEETGKEFPDDPNEQLRMAINAVFVKSREIMKLI